jgi:hypothetical protein
MKEVVCSELNRWWWLLSEFRNDLNEFENGRATRDRKRS